MECKVRGRIYHEIYPVSVLADKFGPEQQEQLNLFHKAKYVFFFFFFWELEVRFLFWFFFVEVKVCVLILDLGWNEKPGRRRQKTTTHPISLDQNLWLQSLTEETEREQRKTKKQGPYDLVLDRRKTKRQTFWPCKTKNNDLVGPKPATMKPDRKKDETTISFLPKLAIRKTCGSHKQEIEEERMDQVNYLSSVTDSLCWKKKNSVRLFVMCIARCCLLCTAFLLPQCSVENFLLFLPCLWAQLTLGAWPS